MTETLSQLRLRLQARFQKETAADGFFHEILARTWRLRSVRLQPDRVPDLINTDADKIVVMAVTQAGAIEAATAALVGGYNRDPFAVLGPHANEDGRGVVIRAFQPAARQIEVRLVATGETIPMTKRDPRGM